MKLTPAKAKERVEEIRASARDPEAAHGLEDKLRADVLRTIAGAGSGLTVSQIRELARIALSTARIEFGRHCA